MIVYNLFPPLAGTFAEWKPHLDRAAGMGFDWVFVNPVQHPGFSGSLYSINDYFRLNSLFVDATDPRPPAEQFQETARHARALNLNLMVDLVISHCAFDSPLIEQHPQWFQYEQGQIVHPHCVEDHQKVVWRDLAKFDHRRGKDKEGLFKFLIQVIDYLADLGFKGFRCDAAYQVPAELWRRLIRETRRKHPGTMFFAETLGCTPQQTVATARAGFDYIFNSSKWWDFRGPWLMEQYCLTREDTRSISFPESHDTPRLAEELEGNVDGVKQRCLFSAIFSSGFMMPMGMEFGFRKRLHVVETRASDWEQTGIDLTGFIRQLNRARSANPIFQEEAPTEILPCDNPNVLFLWKGSLHARQEALIILNKDTRNKQEFRTSSLYQYVQTPGPLTDVSPEYPLDYLPTPFEYGLRPGQGIVLVAGKGRKL